VRRPNSATQFSQPLLSDCRHQCLQNAARADPSHTPAALKERANAAFKAGKVAEARPLYLAALAALSDRLQLMEQRAGASLEAGRPLDALWDATCARCVGWRAEGGAGFIGRRSGG